MFSRRRAMRLESDWRETKGGVGNHVRFEVDFSHPAHHPATVTTHAVPAWWPSLGGTCR